MTVLFADVVHPMDIAAKVGPERLREIMTELVERSAAVVRRYGGSVEFTGDGVMAIFGAPVALEDHAVRACLAALDIQQEANRLAAEVARRDGVELRLRVGLNSGQVIAGEIGSGSFGYTAVGEQVGMAQRMESIAPPRGVMLSASTARLVDGVAALGEPQMVEVKGADEPVLARRLLGMGERHRDVRRAESNLVGRQWEMSTVEGSHHVELLDSIGDPELTVGLLMVPMIVKWSVGEVNEAMELSQRVIDASGGDPTMGNLIVGSPLALALVMRASARCALGTPGWREDFDNAIALARRTDKFTFCAVVMFKYIATQSWALLPNDYALRDTAEALEIAKQFGDDVTLTNAEFTRGLILVRREDADRKLGFELLSRARRVALEHRNTIIAAWCVDIDFAAEKNRIGDYDGAIDLCRAVLENEIRGGEMTNRGWCTTVLVEALLNRGRGGDLDEAQDVIDNLAATPTEPGFVYHELPLLRLNAMLAKARGDQDRYRDFRERYRARAEASGFEGHIALAHAMV